MAEFWGIEDFDPASLDTILQYSPRKSESYNQVNASYSAIWLQMAKNVASGLNVSGYNKNKLEKLFS